MKKTTSTSLFYDCLKTAILLIIAAILSRSFLILSGSNTNIILCYALSIILISKTTTGYFWSLLSALISFIGIYYCHTHLRAVTVYSNSSLFITFFGILLLALMTSTTSVHLKKLYYSALKREEKTKRLNEINNKLLAINGTASIIDLALEYVTEFTGCSAVFYEQSPQLDCHYTIKSLDSEHDKIIHSRHEQFLAHWVFENKQPAGIDTDYSGESSCTYFPLISHDTIWGVMGIYRLNQPPLEQSSISSLHLIMSQIAMAIERQHLSDNQQTIMIETEKEKMRANLLRAVSHDLRTPLTGMIGASETLLKNKALLSEEEQVKLLDYIYEDSNWLLHMVENLLSVTRIREGNSSVNKALEPLEEVVTESIMRIRNRFPDAVIQVKIPDEFIMIPMDATLVEQVIINLFDNAIKYSGSNQPVLLLIAKEKDSVTFNIADEGKGISENKLDSIFDGYSPDSNESSDSAKGIGIGLSICKTIITAHGGTITARNQTNGGAVFTFTLPLEESNE